MNVQLYIPFQQAFFTLIAHIKLHPLLHKHFLLFCFTQLNAIFSVQKGFLEDVNLLQNFKEAYYSTFFWISSNSNQMLQKKYAGLRCRKYTRLNPEGY
jgi:hypothetical protein